MPAISDHSPLSERRASSRRPSSSKTTALTPGSSRQRDPRSARRLRTYGDIGITDKIVRSGDQRTDLLGDLADEPGRIGIVGGGLQNQLGGAGLDELAQARGHLRGRAGDSGHVDAVPLLLVSQALGGAGTERGRHENHQLMRGGGHLRRGGGSLV